MSSLQEVARHRREREEADRHLREVIAKAVEEGITKSAISRATGLSRVTINKWIKEYNNG